MSANQCMVNKYKYGFEVLMVVPLKTKVFWEVMLCRGTNHLMIRHHITKDLNPTYRLDTPSLNFSCRIELHCSSTSSICTFALKLSQQSIHPTACAVLSFYDLFHFTFHRHNVPFLTTILNNFTSLMHET